MSVVLKNITLINAEAPQVNKTDLPVHLVSLKPNPFKYYVDEIKDAEGNVLVSFDKPKEFVPSFDKKLQDKVLILQYSDSKSESEPATISLIMSIDLANHEVSVSGYGFHSVNLVIEINTDSADEASFYKEGDETRTGSMPEEALPQTLDEEEGNTETGEDLGK